MFKQIQRVHLVGAGGIGISAIGKWFLHRGAHVTGSDLVASAQVDELRAAGATIRLGQGVEHVMEDVELVIYSPAVPQDNPERARARELGIMELSYPQALGKLTEDHTTIAVAGTHGKSTTTAMLGLILEAAGMDPTVIVGSKVQAWSGKNFRAGSDDLFIVEACEHLASFLELHPTHAIVTNIEMDHPDFYRDLDHVKETFAQFMNQVKEKVFLNRAVSASEAKQSTDYFSLNEPSLPGLSLKIPGEFNIMNAHAAAAAAKHFGGTDDVIIKTLNAFTGLWRRFEHVAVWRGADIISDYGHHPTAIEATLKGARDFFPNRRIVLCYQPHQHARTKELFQDFCRALASADADIVIVTEIYAVAGRLEEEGEISSQDLVREIKKAGKQVTHAPDLSDAERQLRELIQPLDVVLIMGAGDIDEVARNFI